MTISAADIIPLSKARANLSELAEQVKAGAEKIITKNGESYIAIIDATQGLADVAAGKVKDASSTLSAMKRRRAAKVTARTKSFLAIDALTNYVQRESWQIRDIHAGIKEADAGNFATDQQVKGVFAKYGA